MAKPPSASKQKPVPSAGRKDPGQSVQEAARAVSMRAAVDALAFKRRLQALADGFDGTALHGGESSGVSRAPRQRPGEVLYEAVKLQLSIANELLDFGQSQVDFWVDQLQRMGTSALPRAQRPVTHVETAAPRGGEAVWELYVYNAAHEPREVSLKGKWKVTPPDAAPAWQDPAWERPFVVPAQAEKLLRVTHAVPDGFVVGKTYRARVKVRLGAGKRAQTPALEVGRLDLLVRVTA